MLPVALFMILNNKLNEKIIYFNLDNFSQKGVKIYPESN